MPGAGYIRDRGSQGVQYVDKHLILRRSSRFEPQNQVTVFDDFLIDVLADDPYVTVTQSGTAVTAAAVSATAGDPFAAHGGWIAGGTDDVDAEIDEVAIGGLGTGAGTPWMRPDRAGNGLLVCEWHLTVPAALTARQYFVGLSDDPVEGTGTNGSLNIQTAYTIVDVASDAAGWIFSSLATAPTIWKFGSTIAGAQSTASAATEGVTQVADTDVKCRVEIDSLGNAYFYQSLGVAATSVAGVPEFKGMNALAVTPTVALVPMFTAAPTTTTSVPWEIDYVYASVAR